MTPSFLANARTEILARVSSSPEGAATLQSLAWALGRSNRGPARPPPPASSSSNRPNVLVIDDQAPSPSLGAGAPRAACLLRALAEAATVTHYATGRAPSDVLATRDVPPGVEMIEPCGPFRLSRFLSDRAGHFQTILVSRPANMVLFQRAGGRGAARPSHLVYDAEAIFCDREVARRAVMGRPLSEAAAARLRRRELALHQEADAVLAVTEADAASFRNAGALDVRVAGHALTPRPLGGGPSGREGLLFVGNLDATSGPNLDGLAWFVRAVLPRLAARRAPTTLTIAGKVRAAAAQRLSAPGVTILGPVADLDPLFATHRAFVAPTRFAAGAPHKAHLAASLGLPVVATTLIGRQLGWRDGTELLCADDPEGFASASDRLLGDDALWTRLREAALARVALDCDPDRFRRAVLGALRLEAVA